VTSQLTKFKSLAIDDGSKDDTWYWMNKAQRRTYDRVVTFQQPEQK
jgi:hyaluronan synthase